MKKDTIRQWINMLAVIATVVINGLANALPINNQTTGEISDRFDVFFVPAGYVFSIWGLIYIALIAFAIYQIKPSNRENPSLQRIGYLFAFSCLANIAWLFLWHYEYFALTLVAMFALLALLIAIYLRLGIGERRVSIGEFWFVHVPFSLYLGWITVATIANVTSVLDFYQWNGWGLQPEIWAVIMLIAAGIIGSLVSLRRGDVVYSLVIIWAVIGIAVKQAGSPLVSTVAWLTAVFVFMMILVGLVFARRRRNVRNSNA